MSVQEATEPPNSLGALAVPAASWAAARILLAIPLAGLLLGLAARFGGEAKAASWLWAAGTVPVLAALLREIVASLRRGDVGLDIVAALSMAAALAIGETLAAVVVAIMYAGGRDLEAYAERRATATMTALLAHVPRTALRHRDGGLEEIDLDAIEPGDRLVVRRGDVAPVDGTVAAGTALLDQSALTGESLPVRKSEGEAVMSGAVNAGDAFDLAATRRAAESTYAGIIRLVEAARRSKAPMSRLADRYAMAFLAVTLLLAGGAWLWTADPVRAVAVLVVATPCPLILAVPIALVAGLSRAAGQGILIKSGTALEHLARVRAVVIDKTGTLTDGRPRVVAIEHSPDWTADSLLAVAASLDQVSKHSVAAALVEAARERGLPLPVPGAASETPGEGVAGIVDGRRVIVGGSGFVRSRLGGSEAATPQIPAMPGSVTVAVAVDGRFAGQLVLADGLRHDAQTALAYLRAAGVERVVLATGDRVDIARAVASDLPIDAVRAELSPDEKTIVVLSERKNGPVAMVGDGVNDAPALAAADIGVAMGARGAAAAAEAADVVLLVDRLDRLATAIAIAQRSRAIALQSVAVGIGLSFVGMVAAAAGYLTPVQGALMQEAIDVAVILNALRALRGGTREASAARGG